MSPHPFFHRNTKIKRICGSECLCGNSRVHIRRYSIQIIIKPKQGFSERKIQMVCTPPVSLSYPTLCSETGMK
jgi:hypothetical protein